MSTCTDFKVVERRNWAKKEREEATLRGSCNPGCLPPRHSYPDCRWPPSGATLRDLLNQAAMRRPLAGFRFEARGSGGSRRRASSRLHRQRRHAATASAFTVLRGRPLAGYWLFARGAPSKADTENPPLLGTIGTLVVALHELTTVSYDKTSESRLCLTGPSLPTYECVFERKENRSEHQAETP